MSRTNGSKPAEPPEEDTAPPMRRLLALAIALAATWTAVVAATPDTSNLLTQAPPTTVAPMPPAAEEPSPATTPPTVPAPGGRSGGAAVRTSRTGGRPPRSPVPPTTATTRVAPPTTTAPPVSAPAVAVVSAPPTSLAAQRSVRTRFGGLVVSSGRPAQTVHNLDLQRVANLGADTAAIVVFLEVDPVTQSSVRAGTATISDTELLDTMRRIRALGMRPVVNLAVQCSGCANPWRGALAPADTAGFFASYRGAADRYADLARQGGASLFVVASEMTSLQRHTAEWRRVLTEARARFGGPVSYGANWDAIDGVGFWDAVDVVGVSAYFPLSDAEHPGRDELVAAWHGSRMSRFAGRDWFAGLAELARRTGRTVLFTEAGYRSAAYTARWPADSSSGRAVDNAAQAAAYEALLSTFDGQPWWAGVIWWEWISATPPGDTSFNPRDKDAEAVLRRWYGGRS